MGGWTMPLAVAAGTATMLATCAVVAGDGLERRWEYRIRDAWGDWYDTKQGGYPILDERDAQEACAEYDELYPDRAPFVPTRQPVGEWEAFR